MVREVALYKTPKTPEVVRVLDDSILTRYNDSVKSAYNSENARAVLSKFGKADGELTGSNPFMLVHLQNAGLINEGIATRQDLETALRFNPNIFLGNYIDFGLALRTLGHHNFPEDLLVRVLTKQLSQRGIRLGKGKLIPISALRLREDADSPYGLVFDLSEDVKELEYLSKFKWNSYVDEGLVRAYLAADGHWASSDSSLDISKDFCRVAVRSRRTNAKK